MTEISEYPKGLLCTKIKLYVGNNIQIYLLIYRVIQEKWFLKNDYFNSLCPKTCFQSFIDLKGVQNTHILKFKLRGLC